MKKEQKVGIAVVGIIVLIIVGIVNGGGKSTPASSVSPIASASALASAVASPPATTTSASPAAAAAKAKAKSRRTTVRPATSAAAKSKKAAPPPPSPTTAPAAAPSTPTGCYPLTNGGKCYKPGEYCRNSDHGMSVVAGDGERITCEVKHSNEFDRSPGQLDAERPERTVNRVDGRTGRAPDETPPCDCLYRRYGP